MSSVEETFLKIPLTQIGQSYARLRLIHPQADARMVDSLRRFGQVFPVVVAKREGYELIDGFKRVRALRKLGHSEVMARVLELSVHGQKAALMDLNWKRGSISDLEEGMVVHSLCREDGLSQVQIGVLVGRHKSWVCRRLSLVERLCEEALEHLRLGLIPTAIGRELARLPRGNQEAALRTILKYRFSSRESARLVSLLLQRPRWARQNLLNFPIEILSDRVGEPPRGKTTFETVADLLANQLLDLNRRLLSIADQYAQEALLFTKQEWSPVCSALQRVGEALQRLKHLLEEIRMEGD